MEYHTSGKDLDGDHGHVGALQDGDHEDGAISVVNIFHDHFHVAQHMLKAFDSVHLDEHRALMKAIDHTVKGTNRWWLYGQENLPRHLLSDLANLVASDLQTAKAWTIKEHLRHLWSMTSVDAARDYAISWARAAKDTGVNPVSPSPISSSTTSYFLTFIEISFFKTFSHALCS